jgi:hypothetical protein
MKEKEILKEIIEWLNNDTSYLSTRTDYAKGYKNGIIYTKEIVESIIKKHEPNLLDTNN